MRKKLLNLFLVLLLAVSLVGCTVAASAGHVGQARSELLVDVAWLKANLDEVTLIDARDADKYAAGHIPGAVNAPWPSFTDMANGQAGDKNWGILLPVEQIAEKLGDLGVQADKTVVVYADAPATAEDGRAVWMMQTAGWKNGRMLDGGWQAWQAAQGEVTMDVPVPQPAELKPGVPDESLNATLDWIQANMEDIKFVDSRTVEEYNGSTALGEKRGGHITGAIHIPFYSVYNEDGTVLSTQELKALFTDAGLQPEDHIVVYCTKGVRAAYLTLMLRLAGFENARNYDASIYEWAGDPSLPMEL